MDTTEVSRENVQDHIMANIWRLIFEGKSKRSITATTASLPPDFSRLEKILPEYRMIGHHLAKASQRRYE